ncbi:MAG TPA: helix-turn-helix domain-containing protein [[Clostridium] spiroforme]|uniref:Helix-turn-helix domain-containing protein n=1 Tax=Thomasclavelia spiroformis TaxID=29348 RepID=A0A921KIU4_9FIRM|nr:helix-turn-helix domain-containing protein [Thomasclavelia spiroformis]
MSAKTITGSLHLGEKIRQRRIELGLTIEEAAAKAGVGTKTWSRYEAGGSIRQDKAPKLCLALQWNTLPDQMETESFEFNLDEYRNNAVWPQALAEEFGTVAAVSFVIGSDILLDNIEEDLEALSHMPKGAHLGELDLSWLQSQLPPQFLPRYDYDFLYHLRNILIRFRKTANTDQLFVAHTVAEELILYLIVEESRFLMELILPHISEEEEYDNLSWDTWLFDLFGDEDLITFLYSDLFYLTPEDTYHFDRWWEEQFYSDR